MSCTFKNTDQTHRVKQTITCASQSLICMIQCRECKNIPDTPAKYIHWYVSFLARLDTIVISGVFWVRKSCYLKSTPVTAPVKISVREAADRSMWHLTCVAWLSFSWRAPRWLLHELWFCCFCISCYTFGNVLYLVTLSRYTVSFVGTIVDSLILTMSPIRVFKMSQRCTVCLPIVLKVYQKVYAFENWCAAICQLHKHQYMY